MFDPSSTVTIGQVVSTLKDGAFFVGILIFGWKARALFEPVLRFFTRVNVHMDTMEHGMSVILNNHLNHIEADLKAISGRRHAYSDVNESPIESTYVAFDDKTDKPTEL